MRVYTYNQARQNLTSLFKQVKKEGKVLIKKKDGTVFELKPVVENKSPLEVKGINIEISKEEIIDILREVRER